MMLGICLGTYAGAGLLTRDGGWSASVALGFALMVYSITGLRVSVRALQERWLSSVIGFMTGVITRATSAFVIPAVPYLQALGLTFLISTLALGLSLTSGGVLGSSIAGTSILALAPAHLGMALGQFVRNRVSPAAFRRFFFWGLLVLGGHLALRSLL